MPRTLYRISLVVAIACALWACDNQTTTSPTNPSTPATPTTTTETFEGTLAPNGARTFSFTVGAAGTVTATLTTLQPDPAAAVGLALGTWNGTTCQIVLANDNAVQGTTVTGAVSSAGSLCVRIYDAAGTLAGTVSFVVTVVHP
jgi:hypothetical protein